MAACVRHSRHHSQHGHLFCRHGSGCRSCASLHQSFAGADAEGSSTGTGTSNIPAKQSQREGSKKGDIWARGRGWFGDVKKLRGWGFQRHAPGTRGVCTRTVNPEPPLHVDSGLKGRMRVIFLRAGEMCCANHAIGSGAEGGGVER